MVMDIIEYNQFIKKYKVDILLVVATEVELNAAKKYLSSLIEDGNIYQIFKEDNTYYTGLFGLYSTVIVKTNNMGASSRGASIQTTESAINHFEPKLIIMPGIAFGKGDKKQKIGDILVSKYLLPYELQRLNHDGEIHFRSEHPPANAILLNRFTNLSGHSFKYSDKEINVSITPCALLTGEKLIDNIDYKKKLFSSHPEARGGEMEGLGVYSSADKHRKPWIVVKSICDWADGNKNSDTKKEDQKLAALSSLSYCHKVLMTKNIFHDLQVSEFKEETHNIKEIELDVDDLIHLEVSNRYHSLLNKYIPKEKERHTRYTYYSYKKKNNIEGFLFLGRDIRITKLLEHFKTNNELPDTLIVCMPRNAVYKIKSLKEAIGKLIGNNIVEEVYYLDEFIKVATALKKSSSSDSFHTQNFIDQELFSVSFDSSSDNKKYEISIGHGIEYFSKFLDNAVSHPVSVLFGSAGVGKSTFCDKLEEKLIATTEKYVLKISGEEIINNIDDNDNFQVDSLVDLFEFYKKLKINSAFDIDTLDFELNYISGNIIVIIDGLDEISSVMADRFHFQNFFMSLNTLDQRFHSSNIMITTRDESIEKYIHFHNIDLFQLKGFKEKDVAKFIEKRFPNDKARVSRFYSTLQAVSLEFEDRIAPLFVELICDGIEREDLSQEDTDKSEDKRLGNNYLKIENTFDRILLTLLNRDIQKQSLNMTMDQMVELIFEIMLVNTNVLPIEELELLLSQYTPESSNSTEKYKKNPLFIIDHNKKIVKIKYEAVVDLFRYRYIQFALENKIFNKIYKPYNILRECYQGSGTLFNELISNLHLERDKIEDVFSFFISKIILELNTDDTQVYTEYYKRSISGLLYLALTLSPDIKNAHDRMVFIKQLYKSNDVIKHLYIYGKFFPLDFKDISIFKSEFSAYYSLKDCLFPEQFKKPIFHDTYFKNTSMPENKKLNEDYFEGCVCDETIRNAFENFKVTTSDKTDSIRKDFQNITAKLFNGKKSLNILKQSYTLKTNVTYETFLSNLLKVDYVEFDGQHYGIKKEHSSHAFKLINNKSIPATLTPLYNKFVKLF